MPEENVAPASTPIEATQSVVRKEEGRIQKVDGVVRDADEKVNDCDDPEEGQQHQIVLFHVRCKRW